MYRCIEVSHPGIDPEGERGVLPPHVTCHTSHWSWGLLGSVTGVHRTPLVLSPLSPLSPLSLYFSDLMSRRGLCTAFRKAAIRKPFVDKAVYLFAFVILSFNKGPGSAQDRVRSVDPDQTHWVPRGRKCRRCNVRRRTRPTPRIGHAGF